MAEAYFRRASLSTTGRPVTLTGIDIVRITDNKIVEHWESMDMLGLMQQLGAVSM